ncbi:hypothetical protein [Quisquiliibacterium transsilvanicum]|uniref:Putative metal-dependent hydrolase n=1 Tax=Quisquiliibacterium transsilvanicum TaxID=1549638 RepID=A0A7W8HJI2_9BURK|nr:hypothetical protein [Quisquiliibacterium transsilvanicum]MBB5273229.1 putative metal-dependent hydrolase [Quisquiliibacterium transsilvanicum]
MLELRPNFQQRGGCTHAASIRLDTELVKKPKDFVEATTHDSSHC